MLFDSEEETLTLTMGDLTLQIPRKLLAASPPPSSQGPLFSTPPGGQSRPPLASSSPPPWGEEVQVVEFSDSGLDFYPDNHFDNSFPYPGILRNERRFSASPPASNVSFLSETSFIGQPLFKSGMDGGLPSNNFGLLAAATNCAPFQQGNNDHPGQDFQGSLPFGRGPFNSDFMNSGGGGGGVGAPQELFLPTASCNYPGGNDYANDSGVSSMGTGSGKWDSPKTSLSTPGGNNNNHFDFSFSGSPTSSVVGAGGANGNGSHVNGNASADHSPSRRFGQGIQPNFGNQWNPGDVSSLLDNQSSPESSCSNAGLFPSALGDSIWSPTQLSSANFNNNNNNSNGSGNNTGANNPSGGISGQQWEATLSALTRQQLFAFNQILIKTYREYVEKGDLATAEQIQEGLFQVSQFIIKAFIPEAGHPNECSRASPPMSAEPPPLLPSPPLEPPFDMTVEMCRDANGCREAPYTWSGHLPLRIHRHPVTYSCKVFLGGLPFDITEQALLQALKPFGILKIEWPGKDVNSTKIKGFAYAILESEKHVKLLLQNCTQDYSNARSSGNYFFQVSSKRYRNKDVQIIPWAMSDSNFVRCQAPKIDPLRTVFVGALHGMVNAEGLATIMNDLFGGVVYAGIDTCKLKYPIGSARVTFNNDRSYMRAVTACFVHIKTARFNKKVQVDPYLEDSTCSVCKLQQGPYFCRERVCFSYYCRTCFQHRHTEVQYRSHRPMMRTASNKQGGGGGAQSSHNNVGHSSAGKVFYNSNASSGGEQQLRHGNPQYSHHQCSSSNNNMMMNKSHNNNGNRCMNGSGFNSSGHDHGSFSPPNNPCNNHHHSSNPSVHRNVWPTGNGNQQQRYQPWSNGGARLPSSPPNNNNNNSLMMSSSSVDGQTCNSLFSATPKLNNLSADTFPPLDIPNQGATDFTAQPQQLQQLNSACQHHAQQFAPPFNSHRNIGQGGGFRRQQQQQVLRFQ